MTELFQQDQESLNFWEAVGEAAKAGRSGGYVLEVKLAFGWKVFTSKDDGFTHDQTFFEYQVGGDIKGAKTAANKFIVSNGLTKNPFNVFMILLYKDTILNREVEWKEDRYFFIFPNGYAFNELVMPSMREAGINKLGKFWVEIAWDEDKGGKKRPVQLKDSDGNLIVDENGDPKTEERYPLVAYPVRFFASKEDALEYCGDSVVNIGDHDEAVVVPSSIPMPEGYDEDTWKATIAEIKAELERGTKANKIATDYGLTVALVNQIKSL